MEVSSGEALIRHVPTTEALIKPVPKPFSIEALISDTVPRRISTNTWTSSPSFIQHLHLTKDTDSEGSLDLDLAQDLSRHNGNVANIIIND